VEKHLPNLTQITKYKMFAFKNKEMIYLF